MFFWPLRERFGLAVFCTTTRRPELQLLARARSRYSDGRKGRRVSARRIIEIMMWPLRFARGMQFASPRVWPGRQRQSFTGAIASSATSDRTAQR